MMCDIVVVQSAEITLAKYFISNIKNTVKTSGSWDNGVGVCPSCTLTDRVCGLMEAPLIAKYSCVQVWEVLQAAITR